MKEQIVYLLLEGRCKTGQKGEQVVRALCRGDSWKGGLTSFFPPIIQLIKVNLALKTALTL